MAYSIRPFCETDAEDLAALTLAAINDVGSARYSASQVVAWAARHPGPERFLERCRNGASIIVAADADDKAIAYALLDHVEAASGHLDMLYCHPDHTRRGLADELLAQAEMQARTQSLSRLFTEASELARPAFERAGYTVLHRRDFEIEGVAIHNYAMEKRLE